MSTLSTTRDRLNSAFRSLSDQWGISCGLWNDSKRHRFEREFWQPLETQMPLTLKEMARLAQVIAQARQSVK